MTDLTSLPTGIHPADSSVPLLDALHEHNEAAPLDTATDMLARRARKPWAQPNSRALEVFQRLAHDWDSGVTQVGAAPVKIVARRPGRTSLSLWVPVQYFAVGATSPTTTPAGVLFSDDDGTLSNGSGTPLFVGDSVPVESEGSVWVIAQPGQTLGIVAWLHCWDAQTDPGY